MQQRLLDYIGQSNPWLTDPSYNVIDEDTFVPRVQLHQMLREIWDKKVTVIVGPRQAGKTTLAYKLSQDLLNQHRYTDLVYLNCDELLIREWLTTSTFLLELVDYYQLVKPIIFIDEIQRLTNPGLLLKTIIDLRKPYKYIASGSSQLEIKSKVQEHLTGRQLEVKVLPFSLMELKKFNQDFLIYGCYPDVVASEKSDKPLVLRQLYQNYINKDIIEFLQVGEPDSMQKLISLLAHSSGQLVNYTSLTSDVGISINKTMHYISILENTYTVHKVTPFVGNKRKEITKNPIYYFLDNGFRNQALNNFSNLESRQDLGLLVESYVFQELIKYKEQNFLQMNINFWRTSSGAEVDFVLTMNENMIVPIEVKYRSISKPTLTRSFNSFIDAYKPKIGFIITRDYYKEIDTKGCQIKFIPLQQLNKVLEVLASYIPKVD